MSTTARQASEQTQIAAASPLLRLRSAALSAERDLFLRLRGKADSRLATRARQRGEAPKPPHLLTGEHGEDMAWFYLRGLGYTVVARRWHSARLRGDLDLVAWDGDTLVIVEVKTRTGHTVAPAEAAVDGEKRRMLRKMALAFRKRIPDPWRDAVCLRFDILSVYDLPTGPEFQHHRGAFPLTASR